MEKAKPNPKPPRSGTAPSTLSALEKRIDRALAASSREKVIPRRAQNDFLPLSYMQEGLWALSQIDQEHAALNNPVVLRLKGPLSQSALDKAFVRLLKRHDVLCCRFRSDMGRPVQQYSPCEDYMIPLLDFSDLPADAVERAADEHVQVEISNPLNLYTSPLLRAKLLRLNENEHILVVIFHHLTSDAWSKSIFISELGMLYSEAVEGIPAELPELAIQYADFAAWHRKRLKSPELLRQLDFWKGKLVDLPPAFELPNDHSRGHTLSYPAGVLTDELDEGIIRGLQSVGLNFGATQSMMLLTAFLILLQRFCGQPDLVIGLPIAGRTVLETEKLIGLFINTLVFRCDLSGNPRFFEALDRVRCEVEEVYSNQEIPLEKIVGEVPHERNQGRPPFFQILYNYKNLPKFDVKFSGVEIMLEPAQPSAVRYDLALEITNNGDHLDAVYIYNAAVFEETTIIRLAEGFKVLLNAIIQHPDLRIMDLPVLSAQTRHQILDTWNRTEFHLPGDLCVHHVFEQQAMCTPQAAAIRTGERVLTYSELDNFSSRLAVYLSNNYPLWGQIVAIYMDATPELVISMLAALKAGAAFIVLDPQQPAARMQYELEDAHPVLVLSDAEHSERLEHLGIPLLLVENVWKADLEYPAESAAPRESSNFLAYLIYTSGSTGNPKGVLIPHRALLNRALWAREIFHLCTEDRILQATSLSFDPFVSEIFDALLSGSCICMLGPGNRWNPSKIIEFIDDWEITVVDFVPSLFQLLLEAGNSAEFQTLRHVRCGGDVLPYDTVEKFQKISDAKLHNLYGPAETCIDSAFFTCDDLNFDRATPIGRPIANTQIYILDERLKPVPIGVMGEIYISGEGLAWGYINHPDWTAERFLPNPFGKDGSRMYRTGDLAFFLTDGNIQFVGRRDRQVKLHGVRVELGEIEKALTEHPNVQAAVVEVTKSSEDDFSRLAAYIVQDGDPAETLESLRSQLNRHLPSVMIPDQYIFLKQIPLTQSGKIDHNRLRLERLNAQLDRLPVLPKTPFQKLIAEIWSEILHAPVSDLQANFFELGGNSLIAIRLLARLNDLLGVDLPITLLYETANLAEFVDRSGEVLGKNIQPDELAEVIQEILGSSNAG